MDDAKSIDMQRKRDLDVVSEEPMDLLTTSEPGEKWDRDRYGMRKPGAPRPLTRREIADARNKR